MSIILWWIVFEIGANNRLFLRRVINSFIIRLTRKHVIPSEVPHHHSKFFMGSSKKFQFSHCPYTAESVLSVMWCPKCKHAAVSVYTRVSLYWDRKKDTCVWAWFWRGILNLYFKRLYIIFTNRQAWDMDGSMALLGIKKTRLVWILNIMIQTIKIFQNMIYYTFL